MSTDNKYNFTVIGAGEFELPTFNEGRGGKGWVTMGANDNYAEYLYELYNTSAIHGAVVNSTSDMIAGDGFEGDEAMISKLNKLFNRDIMRRIALDIKLYGHFYLMLSKSRDGKEIAAVSHAPAHTMRSGCADEMGKVHAYAYCSEWKKGKPKGEMKEYPAFDPESNAPIQVLQVKRYSPQSFYYGMPDYIAGTSYIELDREVANFHLNNTKNGMFPSMMISFKDGIPTQEEQHVINQQIKKKFSGAQNAGEIMVTFSDDDVSAPSVEAIQSNANSEMFEYLGGQVSTKILSSHGVTSPIMFGVRGGEGFGNNADELETAYNLYYHTRVRPMQRLILDAIEDVLSVERGTSGISIKESVPTGLITAQINPE